MTYERLEQLIEEYGWDEFDEVHGLLDFLKVCVNESIQECADKADTKTEIKTRSAPGIRGSGGAWREISVDKQSILNLKVK